MASIEPKKRHVLVIDDDHDFAYVLKDFLQPHGYHVHIENDLASAQKTMNALNSIVALLEKQPESNSMTLSGFASPDAPEHLWRCDACDHPSLSLEPDVVLDALERRFTSIEREEKRDEYDRMRALYHESPAMCFAVNRTGVVIEINSFAAKTLGYSREQLIGSPLHELVFAPQRQALDESIASCFSTPESLRDLELRYVCRDKRDIWVRQTARSIPSLNGEPATLVVCEDITQARELSQQLSYQASHDELTGLANRREFEIRLARVVQAANNGDADSVMCYLDLDQFKIINDSCGHIAGDQLLREIGDVLAHKIRKHDTLARLGGDEFGILLDNCPLIEAMRVTEALRQSVEDFRFSWNSRRFKIGISIGVVVIDAQVTGPDAVLSAADSACYTAKDQGRNRIHLYREDSEALALRKGEAQWANRIQRALDENRFELAFQPFFRLSQDSSEAVDCFEILVRMREEDDTVLQPSSFLPAAERYHLAVSIDRWVLIHTMKFFHEHPAHAEKVKTCSINLSGQSLCDPEFICFAMAQIAKGPLPGERICLEITETAAMANLKGVDELLHAAHEQGVRVALDDFGSGFSSFAYLKNLAVDFIKIDGKLIKDMLGDSMDLTMVKSINEVAQGLGKKTIAEFVEDESIRHELRTMGVDYGQGFGMAKPRPLDQIFQA